MPPLTPALSLLLLVLIFGSGGYADRSYGGWGGYRSGPGFVTVLLIVVLVILLLRGGL